MRKLHLFTAFILTVTSTAGQAQEINKDEVLSLFNAQREAFTTLREEGTLKTRGLTLVTVGDVEPAIATEIEAPDAPVAGTVLEPLTPPEDTDVTQVAPSTLAAPVPETTVTYGRLDQDRQLNLAVKFAFDSATIEDNQKPTLDQMCVVMRDSDVNEFRIVGHTDASGSDDYNERLSRLRAEEVARYLVGSCGIASSRLDTLGLGERFPFNEIDPDADENRRVEFQALS